MSEDTTADTSGFDGDDDLVPVVQSESKPIRKRKAIQKEVKPEMVKLQLEEVDNMAPTGQFFGINGKAFNLRPGEPAIVPIGILNILNDAIMSVPILNADSTVSGYRDRLRFPYRIIS